MPKKILVIEDAQSLRKDIMEMLTSEGYLVEGAENGVVGLKKVHSFVPDLVTCDIMMPEMDGYQVLEHIRNDPITAALPVIILTARTDRTDMRMGMELGADDFLTKPFHAVELLGSVRARLRRQDQILGIPTPKQSKRLLYHAFLSYARVDALVMGNVKSHLLNEYLNIWTDENLEPGTPEWQEAIETSIRYSGSLIVIMSPDSKKSKWVNRELAYAEMHGVQVFPLLVRGEPNEVIPISLVNSQRLDIRSSFEPEMKKLVKAIKEHVGMNL
jgi:CheY-like chemotaxis protein